MSAFIIYRCPHTGMDVQTSLQKENNDAARTYETVTCSACTRIHLINTTTGTVAGMNK
jgi:hypothetical protein